MGDGSRELAGCGRGKLVSSHTHSFRVCRQPLTLGQTRTQETGNLLDESIGSNEGIVLASKLLDELLVLVELLQVISRHGVNTAVLGTIKIVLVTEDAVEKF